jgi:hypothetical protein
VMGEPKTLHLKPKNEEVKGDGREEEDRVF